jgi:hypothetical protein
MPIRLSKPANPIVPSEAADRFRPALELLLQAHDYSRATGRDPLVSTQVQLRTMKE